jgi:hypothetical protein
LLKASRRGRPYNRGERKKNGAGEGEGKSRRRKRRERKCTLSCYGIWTTDQNRHKSSHRRGGKRGEQKHESRIKEKE